MANTHTAVVPTAHDIDELVDRLAARFPSAERPRLRGAVDGAIVDLAHARVHQFLPILIERTAVTTLRRELGASEEPRS